MTVARFSRWLVYGIRLVFCAFDSTYLVLQGPDFLMLQLHVMPPEIGVRTSGVSVKEFIVLTFGILI